MKIKNVFIGLGSNVGDKKSTVLAAINKIKDLQDVEIIQVSNNYYSEPWGFDSEEYFLNCVVELNTNLSPLELLTFFKTIEYELGRDVKKTKEYQDRTIDIDILYYSNKIVDQDELRIPHPKISERLFVLKPLFEIAPYFQDPITLNTMEDLLNNCKDISNIFNEEMYFDDAKFMQNKFKTK